ncbi:hypothetical protein BH23BAC3_BH23BAC3_06090 [soil metagenome]
MNRYALISAILINGFLIASCSTEPEITGPVIEGQITVDPDLDSSMDYSGIELLIAYSGVDGVSRDTLFHSVTDSTGWFSGIASIEERGIYPVLVSRNNNHFGLINLVLANDDTVRLNAQLPDINETIAIQSFEHDAYERFERLQRNFNRVVSYINNVGMSQDSVETEIYKWSDLFWVFYNRSENTLAGEQSAATSISILEGWDNDLMLARTDSLLDQKNTLPADLRYQLTHHFAETEGLDRTIAFLDQLDGRLDRKEDKLTIRRDKIELLFDSSRTDNAQLLLEDFKQTYSDNESAMVWAENMTYDLATLAPGNPFPEFSFADTEGEEVSSQTLENSPYLIEITGFDNPLYQEQYDQMVVIHQIYSNHGLNIVTIPLATSPVALESFFDDRIKLWSVIDPGSFDADELIDNYNIQHLPTRFLVNDQGTIIRRYVGAEFSTIVQGLQNIITQQQEQVES